jgi:hypothetical protein
MPALVNSSAPASSACLKDLLWEMGMNMDAS